jgi:enhancer of polycomb-like protein
MIDALEKATGHESIVTIAQAEEVLVGRMPCLADIFGPLSERERRMEEEEDERHLSRWLKDCDAAADLPTLAPPVTLPEVIRQVYNYWVAKRSKMRKPLLRRYWPPTSASDLNPHQVFRQRDKEKRRLRKKRQNDLEAYRKMRQLRADFERVGMLCDLILRREEVNSTLNDYYEERIHRWTDTTKLPRRSQTLDRSAVERALELPRYFDDRPIVRTRGGNKRKRGPKTGWKSGSNAADGGRVPSPVPPPGAGGGGGVGGPHPTNPAAGAANNVPPHHHHGTIKPPPPMTAMSHLPPRNIVVAGHDGGFPAPNFLQPLASRESHFVTSWDDAVPSMPSYVNGACTTSCAGPGGGRGGSFRHRPRLGRGGRVVIDRVPRPSTSSFGLGGGGGVSGPPEPTVVTYGLPMGRCGYHVAPLGADGPHYAVRSGGPNDDDEGGPSVAAEEGRGTDAKTAPRAPPARNLLDLLPKSLGDPTSLSRRIEEICVLALMEDYQTQGNGGTATAVSASAASSLKGGSNNAASSVTMTLAEEMDEVLVPIEDWMEAPEGMRIYGSEKFVIGPL